MLKQAKEKYEKLGIKEFNNWLKNQTFYGGGLNLSEIGYIMGGVTREYIRQVEKKALRKLKNPRFSNSLKTYMFISNNTTNTEY